MPQAARLQWACSDGWLAVALPYATLTYPVQKPNACLHSRARQLARGWGAESIALHCDSSDPAMFRMYQKCALATCIICSSQMSYLGVCRCWHDLRLQQPTMIRVHQKCASASSPACNSQMSFLCVTMWACPANPASRHILDVATCACACCTACCEPCRCPHVCESDMHGNQVVCKMNVRR